VSRNECDTRRWKRQRGGIRQLVLEEELFDVEEVQPGGVPRKKLPSSTSANREQTSHEVT
jgi:hypothetical protein